jgi:hypothetical protein
VRKRKSFFAVGGRESLHSAADGREWIMKALPPAAAAVAVAVAAVAAAAAVAADAVAVVAATAAADQAHFLDSTIPAEKAPSSSFSIQPISRGGLQRWRLSAVCKNII